MFTAYTYQDWLQASEDSRPALALSAIGTYQSGDDFNRAKVAQSYFDAQNDTITHREKMQITGTQKVNGSAKAATGTVQGACIINDFFFIDVTQMNQFLLANGLQLKEDGAKEKLGPGFDKTLESLGESALIHGVSWAFWNFDHIEAIKAYNGTDNGFVALVDERTSEPMVGIHFWRIAETKPMYFRIFELDGVSEYAVVDGKPVPVSEKRTYQRTVRKDVTGTRITGMENYGSLPLIPLYANSQKRSELKESLKSKIDAYDVIISDFSDNLERTNDIYWVINNFGGTSDDVIAMLAEINRIKATYTESNGRTQSTAEPHTIEVPYQARTLALDLLEKELYKDAMALNMNELTGGSLTNVAIKTAMTNLNLKTNRYEWQVYQFCQKLLNLLGIEVEDIRFRRQTISNESEIVNDIYVMREDITRRKALELNPYIQDDEIEQILKDKDAEDVSGLESLKALQDRIDAEDGGDENEQGDQKNQEEKARK